MRMLQVASIASAIVFSQTTTTYAQAWPDRPVRIVNTFAAGATADALARMVADHLSKVFKQTFYVESRPGGAGLIGINTVLNSPADGYNLVLTNSGQMVVAPLANPNLTYDPLGDFVHVGIIAGSPVAFSTSPKTGIRSIPDLIKYAKSNKDAPTYSWSGIGTNGQFLVEAFAHEAGIGVRHIPYKGAAQGLMDVVAGHVVFGASTVSSTAGQIKAGALIPLAHTGTERMQDYPEIPTLKELGYADLVSDTWFAISAPATIPNDIAEKLNKEINAALQIDANREFLRKQGLVTSPMTIDELHSHIAAELKRWKPTVERIAIPAR